MRVLVVEDDLGISGFLKKGLQEESFAVDVAADGHSGFQMASTGSYDVIILDLMLPGRDGLDILRELRDSGSATPVICLTARDAIEDRIRGLDLGADDYLPKPFRFAELLARVRALLRRSPMVVKSSLQIGDLTVDLLARVVRRAGEKINLSAREFSLLEYMARHAGEFLSRTMILERVWDIDGDPRTNVVDVHINRLRKKIDHGFDSPLIHTIRGVGYVLRAVDE